MNASFAIAAMLALTTAPLAQACSCFLAPPPLKAMAKADAVFTGTVTKLVQKPVPLRGDQRFEGFEVTVTIAKSLKGGVAGIAVVYTGVGTGDCGFQFHQGEKYLFYAYRVHDGHWYTDSCTRTNLLTHVTNEILELEGRLPPPDVPSQNPVLELKGRINDAGYAGYVFTFRNRLHERAFYFDYNCPGHRIQVLRDGRWRDYPPNNDIAPRPELSAAAAAEAFAQWKAAHAELLPDQSAFYLDRLSSRPVFVALPTTNTPWRVGFQYLTERELDAGTKLQDSEHFVWSDAIDTSTPTKSLSFKEAFQSERE